MKDDLAHFGGQLLDHRQTPLTRNGIMGDFVMRPHWCISVAEEHVCFAHLGPANSCAKSPKSPPHQTADHKTHAGVDTRISIGVSSRASQSNQRVGKNAIELMLISLRECQQQIEQVVVILRRRSACVTRVHQKQPKIAF